jgi:UDP-N-acetylmuramyl pentapeptide phosphotransferase/UDP-N-acetylglucosamine-1-phosphate transferase
MELSLIINALIIFILGMGVASLCIPLVIKLAIKKRLFDENGGRHVHKGFIPRLGGVAIFVGFLFSQLYFAVDYFSTSTLPDTYLLLLFSLGLLFILGLMDDLVNINANLKFIIQLLVAVILVWRADIRIESFYGLFGIEILPLWFSYAFSILVITFFVNAYNLIDGLDSLSSSVGIYVLLCFTGVFLWNEAYVDSMLAFSAIGSLLGFWFYNKPPARIFMGDSGTLSMGLLLAYFSIRVSNLPLDVEGTFNPVFAMVVLAYPVIDTLRVFTKRILKGISPFTPDRNHIHHALLDLGLGHGKSTAVIVLFSFFLSTLAYLFRMDQTLSFVILVPLILFVSQVPFLLLRLKNKRRVKMKKVD